LKQTTAQAILLPVATVALLGLNLSARATTLIVGNPSAGGNLYPFITYTGEYQLDYANSLFTTGPITITSIGFASAVGSIPGLTDNGTIDDTFNLSLAPTTANPDSLSTTFVNNETTPLTQVFTGTESATLLGTDTMDFIIPITPFTFDPSTGDNLLMDIYITNDSYTVNTQHKNGSFYSSPAFAMSATPSIGRVYTPTVGSPGVEADNEGLVTQFGFTPASTPEPSPLVALTAAFAMTLGLLLYKKKRAP